MATEPAQADAGGARIIYAMLARIPDAGRADFWQFESAVLPLLAAHAGRLERRLRNAEGTVELHLVSFPSTAAFEHYRDDPQRRQHLGLLESSGAGQELFELHDVE